MNNYTVDYTGLHQVMKRKNIDNAQLQAGADINLQTIIKIATGKMIYKEEAQRIAEFLQCDITELAKFTDKKSAVNKPKKRSTAPVSVAQYDARGNLIKIYSSINEAARAVKGCPSAILKCLKSERQKAYGYIWKYADEEMA